MCYRKRHYVSFAWIIILILVCFTLYGYFSLPSDIVLVEGERIDIALGGVQGAEKVAAGGELGEDGLEGSGIKGVLGSFHFSADEEGTYQKQFLLFDRIPVKSVSVTVIPPVEVIPCGNAIGVKIETDGVLVIGMSNIYTEDDRHVNPARSAKVKQGDIITKINGNVVADTEMLKEFVQGSQGQELEIELLRDGKPFVVKMTPERNASDGLYHIGAWVRDSTAGIGTLTFYDPKSGQFGALGHGITDVDTNDIMLVGKGEILPSTVTGVKKGEAGQPGELRGTFATADSVGRISENTSCGIFGQISSPDCIPAHEPVAIATRNMVETGPAQIISNVDGDTVEYYDVEIQKVSLQNWQSSKGMVLKITDQRLIDKTGGIVQGMSGSPIIQNGKLIGAVTHVFVNDPLRGYGIFIDNMLNK